MIKKLPVVPPNGCKYLLDANIWVKGFIPKPGLYAPINSFPKDERFFILQDRTYFEFVQNLLRSNAGIIILPLLVFSEVLNVAISEGFAKYKKLYGPKLEKKKHYRASSDFLIDYNLIRTKFLTYEHRFDYIPDEFGSKYNLFNSLQYAESQIDFNDNYYYKIAKDKNYTIVTNDSDFKFTDVEIFTLNTTLLNHK